jgi:hypothetical protein
MGDPEHFLATTVLSYRLFVRYPICKQHGTASSEQNRQHELLVYCMPPIFLFVQEVERIFAERCTSVKCTNT